MATCIGSATEKYGKTRMIVSGLFVIAVTIIMLIIHGPFWISFMAVALLSLGYVMTQPLFAGVFNNLRNGKIRGVTLGLGTCLLFVGYGTGPVIFQYLLGFGIEHAIVLLALLELSLAFLSLQRLKNKA
jgi:MFS family permease